MRKHQSHFVYKGVPMSHIATQTNTEGKPPSPAPHRAAAIQRSQHSRVGASETTTRSSSVRRVSTSGGRRENSVDARSQRQRVRQLVLKCFLSKKAVQLASQKKWFTYPK